MHKVIADVCVPFGLILSAIGTPSYKLVKFLVLKFCPNTFNEFIIKGSFAFGNEIADKGSKFFMGSLNVDSLFTNIPLEKTFNLSNNLLYNNEDVIEGTDKSEFKNLHIVFHI